MAKAKKDIPIQAEQSLFTELAQLIEQSQQQVVAQANSTLTLLFWQVGKRINENIPQKQTGRLFKTNCGDSVGTIGKPVWKKF